MLEKLCPDGEEDEEGGREFEAKVQGGGKGKKIEIEGERRKMHRQKDRQTDRQRGI